MEAFNMVASSDEGTVVARYVPMRRDTSYQSEADMERRLVTDLCDQGYEYLPIHSEADLIANLRARIEALNSFKFSDTEWERFFHDIIAGSKGILEKTEMVQEDNVQVLERDDGTSKNVTIIDKENVHANSLQVIDQYVVSRNSKASPRHDNRYDVTILVNGLPLVHIELKRRGVRLREAFNQIERYQRDSFWSGSGLFEYVQVFVISNGTETKYYSNSTRWNAIRGRASVSSSSTSNSFRFATYWSDAENKPIMDIEDFTRTFLSKRTLLNVLTRYCILTSGTGTKRADRTLMVLRPYQIVATERILERIQLAHNYKWFGSRQAGGYVWHASGSGKTVTSFKTARMACSLPYIDKVLFVVDRKDLDYQTMAEYDKFEKGTANGNTSTKVLERQLRDPNTHIVITTIQKLATLIRKNERHEVYDKEIVIIFDECHRSQFGAMHKAITSRFKRYYIFGFTGTPIFSVGASGNAHRMSTTEGTFGDCLHRYTMVDAINDGNVLPFHVEYVSTMGEDEDMVDEEVIDIDRQRAFADPRRVSNVTSYVLEHFDQKTYRRSGHLYQMSILKNVADVARRKGSEPERERRSVRGFNSIFAASSIPMAMAYYAEFKRQMEERPEQAIRVALIYSYEPNERTPEGILDEEDIGDTSRLDQPSREFLEGAISDYNEAFGTAYDTTADKFQNYYRDVSMRMKNKEIDLLIVVNMFLTGFDATTLNTLWVDKPLKEHGLIQAFSRTNRILNDVKRFGNIVCFRPLAHRVDMALSLFGDKDASSIALIRPIADYYDGYDDGDEHHDGYVELVRRLRDEYPIGERIDGEKRQKGFISLMGSVLRQRNVLVSFDEFGNKYPDVITDGEMQDYLGVYQDLRDEYRSSYDASKVDINDDVTFEMELVRQDDISVDYILMLVEGYHEQHTKDADVFEKVRRLVEASPSLRSKRKLIEAFIEGLTDVDDAVALWDKIVSEKREEAITGLISKERLDQRESRRVIRKMLSSDMFEVSDADVARMLPPMPLFGSANGRREEKKARVMDELQRMFDTFHGAIA